MTASFYCFDDTYCFRLREYLKLVGSLFLPLSKPTELVPLRCLSLSPRLCLFSLMITALLPDDVDANVQSAFTPLLPHTASVVLPRPTQLTLTRQCRQTCAHATQPVKPGAVADQLAVHARRQTRCSVAEPRSQSNSVSTAIRHDSSRFVTIRHDSSRFVTIRHNSHPSSCVCVAEQQKASTHCQ